MKYLKFLFAIFLLFSAEVSFAQKKINEMDANGKRHGAWKKTYPSKSQIRFEGQFDHGKEVGTFKFYCDNCKDQPSAVQKFNANNDLSEIKFYSKEGFLLSEGTLKGKERTGKWITYSEIEKSLLMEENYLDDKLDGHKKMYFSNGKVSEESHFKNGLQESEFISYYENGNILKKLNYKNGLLNGPAVYFDANGNKTMEGSYKNGENFGLWKYFKNGSVIMEDTFPKGN